MILIGGEQKNQAIKTDGICTCLCSSMGSGGGYVPMIVLEEEKQKDYISCENRVKSEPVKVFEKRLDEGIRLWNDEVCGTLRTIDACGDKYVLVKNG